MKLKKLFGGLLVSASLWVSSHAQVVGVLYDGGYSGSANGLVSYLNTQGFTASALASAPGSFTGYDAIISIRSNDPGAALSSWVNAGGLLITEWTSTDWAAPLIGASISSGGFIGTSTPISFTAAGLSAGLGNGLPNPYSDSGATEFFRNFSSTGTGTVWATRGANIPVVVQGDYGTGSVLLMAHDWADTGFDANGYVPTDPTAIFIRNALLSSGGGNAAVPEPSTYGLIGAVALLGLIARKRFFRRAA